MTFEYFNQFNLQSKLAEEISYIISQKEKCNFVCKHITITIPEHEGFVFSSPLDDYRPYGGGLKALSGAQINYINEKYGKQIIGTIPEQEYTFLVIMKKDSLEFFNRLSFENCEEINNQLNSLDATYEKYEGVFNSSLLTKKFPYLQDFFDFLDDWRSKTGRILIDEDILVKARNKTLKKSNKINKR